MRIKRLVSIFFGLSTLLFSIQITPAKAELTLIRDIVFPVIGSVSYGDDFGDPRSGGRSHEGNDIMGTKMMPLVAVVDGTISYVNYPEQEWGYSIGIRDADGYQYRYLHMNNDNPKTDDGSGGGMHAYAVDMMRNNKVVKGQLIGWMGDSGNAETTSPHLHFEIRTPDGAPMSPYMSLKSATKITTPVANYPVQPNEILPYDSFDQGASIALGNLDTDTETEIVSSARSGGGPLIRTFKSNNTPLTSFYAYDPGFRGGADVATGDTDGDGVDEIITSAGPGGGPHIRIFKANGTIQKEFFAYDEKFRGGVNVSAADIDGDNKMEIITAPATAGGPHVRVFKADGTLVKEFFAYPANFTKGIDISAANYGNQQVAIVTAPNTGGGSHIKVFNKDGILSTEFFAYGSNFFGGTRIAASRSSSSLTSQLQITTAPASTGGPHVRVFNESGIETQGSLTGFEHWWVGGYDIAARNGKWYMTSVGGRRTSIREVLKTQQDFNRDGFSNIPRGFGN